MGGYPADALPFEIVAVADLFVIEESVPGVGDAVHGFYRPHLQLLIEAAGPAAAIIVNDIVYFFVNGDAAAGDVWGQSEEGTHIPLHKIAQGGAPAVDLRIGGFPVLGLHMTDNGAIAAVVPGIEGAEEVGMYQVIGIEDDQHFVLPVEVAPAEIEGGQLIVEGDRWPEYMDAGVAEDQAAGVAIIGDDIDVEPGVGLFQEGVDDGWEEGRFAVGGDDDAELVVPCNGMEWGGVWPDAEEPGDAVDQEQDQGLDQPGGEEDLEGQVGIGEGCPDEVHWISF